MFLSQNEVTKIYIKQSIFKKGKSDFSNKYLLYMLKYKCECVH